MGLRRMNKTFFFEIYNQRETKHSTLELGAGIEGSCYRGLKVRESKSLIAFP